MKHKLYAIHKLMLWKLCLFCLIKITLTKMKMFNLSGVSQIYNTKQRSDVDQ